MFFFTFTLKTAKKFLQIYGSKHYKPIEAFLDRMKFHGDN